MATKKSEIINILSDNYPNFYKKDLKKLINIFIFEVSNSLKRHERVELETSFIRAEIEKSKICKKPQNK